MENINATAVFFSPTDTSRTGVCAIARALSSEFSELDLTCAPAQATFGEKEVVVFGAPVYGGRIPAVCRERMAGPERQQYAVYHNRNLWQPRL